MLMHTIGEEVLRKNKDAIISLIHEHSDYDSVMVEAFNQVIDDHNFEYRTRFANITPTKWQDCIALQPTDFMAYEYYKESERHLRQIARERRKSLKAILDEGPGLLGGHVGGFNQEVFQTLKRQIDKLDKRTKAILFATARIGQPKKVKRERT